jgi:pimeloyl-ACP methyl ester carboxylesterase
MGSSTRLAIGCVALMLSFAYALSEPATATEADPGLAATDGAATVPSAIVPDQPLWWRCGDATTTVECAWLVVPIDHADPESDTIRLLASRMVALEEADRVGVLVTIAGGPGQRGTDGIHPGAHTTAIQEMFDVVSWDPRGTSHESVIDCIPDWDPFGGLDRTPDTAPERQALDEAIAALATRCREAHGDLLPFVGTLQTALDLERLRQMLGEPQISILGTSYGSQVAVVYATLFPDRVRAMVLDGYSDPNLSPGDREIEQAAAYEHELDELLAECGTDPMCPLYSDGKPGLALDRLLERLDAAPIPVDDAGGRSVSQSDAHEAIVGYLTRDERARRRLLEALGSAALGRGRPLLRIADDVRHGYESSGLTQGAFMAVYCADAASYWDGLSQDEVEDLVARTRQVAPRLGAWLWSPPSADGLPPVGLCAMQPRITSQAADLTEPFDAAGAGPILVLAATGDPTTPIAAARRAIEDLEQAVLLTLDKDHHLSYHYALGDQGQPAYRCVLATVEAYLIDLQLPVVESMCADGGVDSS